MRNGERVGHLHSDRESAFELQRLAVDQLANVAPGNVLHGDEVDTVDDVEVKNRADVRVV